jgi:hypothetical protein
MGDLFVSFTENIAQGRVLAKPDYTAPNLDKIAYKIK